MRNSRFTEAQIVAMLSQFEAGASAEEIGRRYGVHANTIRMWRAKYAGMAVSDSARLKQLGRERADAAHHRPSNAQARRHGGPDRKKLVVTTNDSFGLPVGASIIIADAVAGVRHF